MSSVPARSPFASAPAVDPGPWADPGGDSPAVALQRRLAREWTPALALPPSSGIAPRLERMIVAASRVAGPILFGATLAAIATALT